jgi:hypothetical protein
VTRTSTAPHEEGAVTSLVEPTRAPNLAPQRERPSELDPDHGPRLRAPTGVQHRAQDAVDAELRVPETHAVQLFNQVQSVGRQMRTQIIASALVRGLIRSSEERIAPRVEFRRRELTLSPCRLWH